jgi:hypothetical protein
MPNTLRENGTLFDNTRNKYKDILLPERKKMEDFTTASLNQYVLFDFKENPNREIVFRCKSTLLTASSKYKLIHKKLVSKYTNTKSNEPLDINIDIFLTHKCENGRDRMIRGYLYLNDKEYPILEYDLFSSLQIGKWCYDNIAICTMPCNPFLLDV